MNRYENGKIYKITDVGYNKYYSILEAPAKVWVKEWQDIENIIRDTKKELIQKRLVCLNSSVSLELKTVKLSWLKISRVSVEKNYSEEKDTI